MTLDARQATYVRVSLYRSAVLRIERAMGQELYHKHKDALQSWSQSVRWLADLSSVCTQSPAVAGEPPLGPGGETARVWLDDAVKLIDKSVRIIDGGGADALDRVVDCFGLAVLCVSNARRRLRLWQDQEAERLVEPYRGAQSDLRELLTRAPLPTAPRFTLGVSLKKEFDEAFGRLAAQFRGPGDIDHDIQRCLASREAATFWLYVRAVTPDQWNGFTHAQLILLHRQMVAQMPASDLRKSVEKRLKYLEYYDTELAFRRDAIDAPVLNRFAAAATPADAVSYEVPETASAQITFASDQTLPDPELARVEAAARDAVNRELERPAAAGSGAA